MSTLTKIFVVLLVVVVLFSAPIIINQAVSIPNWRDYAKTQENRAKLAETEAKNHMLAAQVLQQYLKEEKLKGDELATRLREAIDSKSVDVAKLTRDKAELLGRINELTASVDALQETIKSAQKQNEGLAAELEKQRGENIKLADLLRQQQDKIKEYLVNIEQLGKTVDALKEQLAQKEGELKETLDKVAKLEQDLQRVRRGGVGGVAGSTRETPVQAPKIDASVTAVQNDLASLNVGSASGVKAGMEFVIYRNATFVAHLRVSEVFATSCAGIVQDAVRDVHQGDKATTSLE